MKHVHKSPDGPTEDDQGFLHDPGVRAAMAPFALGGDTLALEAAAAVRSAAQAVDRLRGHGAGGRGLSAGALDILVRLNTGPEEGLSIGELARAAGVSSRNVTGLVDTLALGDLVERVPDKRDRRSVRVRVTAGGREWLTAFRAPANRAMDALFAGFTPDDLTLFQHLCLRLVENQRRIEQHLDSTREKT